MTEFLAWLWGVANYVYQWFGQNFWSYLNIVSNTWNWIVREAQKAYDNAVRSARYWIDELADDVRGLFDWVSYQFDNFTQGIRDDFSGLYDWVSYTLNNVLDTIQPALNDFAIEFYDFVNNIPDSIQNWISDRLEDVRNWVMDNFGWLLDAYNQIVDMVSAIPTDILGSIRSFFNDEYPMLVQFIENPVSFIFDLLWEKFISAVCFIIAHELGTTTRDLPTQPPWKE